MKEEEEVKEEKEEVRGKSVSLVETVTAVTTEETKQSSIKDESSVAETKHREMSSNKIIKLHTSEAAKEERDRLWDDVERVSYEFINLGKPKSNGILTTHDRSYRYHKNQESKDGSIHYYHCPEKKRGCEGRASIKRVENFDETRGGLLIENRLVAVTRPEVHSRVHPPENSAILAASLVASMKQEVARDPAVQISKK